MSEYLDYLRELLSPLGSIRTRRMFGGWGISSEAMQPWARRGYEAACRAADARKAKATRAKSRIGKPARARTSTGA